MIIPEYENYQENKSHGETAFPFDTYLCTIPQDFSFVPLHWHSEMEIIYIKNGEGYVSVNLTVFPVAAGTIVFVLPGQLHAIWTDQLERMEYENIIFNTNLLQTRHQDVCTTEFLIPLFSGKIAIPVCFSHESPHYQEIADILNACDQIRIQKPVGMEFYLKSQLFYIFFILQNRCQLNAPELKPSKNLERMKPVLKYIELHYHEPISVEQISDVAACSPSHFMRIFKETFQCTFVEYLNDYRLAMAARLLTGSNLTVLSIASDVGFDNLSYFNRSFKAKYGVSPGKYRKSVKTE